MQPARQKQIQRNQAEKYGESAQQRFGQIPRQSGDGHDRQGEHQGHFEAAQQGYPHGLAKGEALRKHLNQIA